MDRMQINHFSPETQALIRFLEHEHKLEFRSTQVIAVIDLIANSGLVTIADRWFKEDC